MTKKNKDETITRTLPFLLRDNELAVVSKSYVDLQQEVENAEALANYQMKAAKKQIEEIRQKLKPLRQVLATRCELRVVDCMRELDLPSRSWRIRRLDTMEVVDLEPLSAEEVAEERQLDLTDALKSDLQKLRDMIPPNQKPE